MDDLISRQAAVRWIKTECNPYGNPTIDFESGKKIIEHLEQMPTIDPVKHGKWELVDEAEPRRYGCSECKRLSYTQDNYCSYCGAKMKRRSFLMNWSE